MATSCSKLLVRRLHWGSDVVNKLMRNVLIFALPELIAWLKKNNNNKKSKHPSGSWLSVCILQTIWSWFNPECCKALLPFACICSDLTSSYADVFFLYKEAYGFYYNSWAGSKNKFGGTSSKTCWDGCWNQESWYWLANVSIWKLQQIHQCHRYD